MDMQHYASSTFLKKKNLFLLQWSIKISKNLLCLIIRSTCLNLTMFTTSNNYHFHRTILSATSQILLFQITNLMHNSFVLQQYVCYTTIRNMFRAARCSSSGGQIVSPQPLVSSLFTSSRTVCILYGCFQRVTIPEVVVIQFVLRMSSVLLETC